jgi:hypothetical protein
MDLDKQSDYCIYDWQTVRITCSRVQKHQQMNIYSSVYCLHFRNSDNTHEDRYSFINIIVLMESQLSVSGNQKFNDRITCSTPSYCKLDHI